MLPAPHDPLVTPHQVPEKVVRERGISSRGPLREIHRDGRGRGDPFRISDDMRRRGGRNAWRLDVLVDDAEEVVV